MKQQEIYRHAEEDTLPMFVNKHLKDMGSEEELQVWFQEAERIEKDAPPSFLTLTRRTGYSEKSFFTQEDYQEMLRLEQELVGHIMPLYPQQLQATPKRYLFCLTAESSWPPKGCPSVRLKCSREGDQVSVSVSALAGVNRSTVLIFGRTSEASERETEELLAGVAEVGVGCEWKFKVMMWQQALDYGRGPRCQIY